MADGVELIGEFEGSGFKTPRYMVRRADGQIIQLTDLLYLIVERCDGVATTDEIAEAVGEIYGRAVSGDNVETLLNRVLRRDGIVTWPDGSVTATPKQDPFLALRFRITLLPERVTNFFAVLLKPLFWPPLVVAIVAGLVAADVWYFGMHGVAQGLRALLYQPLLALVLYGLLILSVGWHELGHAAACRYGGARPGRIGFGIYVVWPAFFTDVTDAYRLNKRGRIRTDLGGIYFNAIFCLGVVAAYAMTGFEPLLILIVVEHLLIAYQFMPFLRLDGYQVMSDATGVPDLFSRVGPVLTSLIPFKKAPRKVKELRPWVRVVVTAWVVAVVPFLIYMFSMMVMSAPRVLATAWDSFFVQKDAIANALRDGQMAAAATASIQTALLVLPILGMSVTLTRVATRAGGGVVRLTADRPVVRGGLCALALPVVAAIAFSLWPHGNYSPIQPHERWAVGDPFHSSTSGETATSTATAVDTSSNTNVATRGPSEPGGGSRVIGTGATPGGLASGNGSGGSAYRVGEVDGNSGSSPSPSGSPSPTPTPSGSESPSTSPSPSPSGSPQPTPSSSP